jgi:hypothetical protein
MRKLSFTPDLDLSSVEHTFGSDCYGFGRNTRTAMPIVKILWNGQGDG